MTRPERIDFGSRGSYLAESLPPMSDAHARFRSSLAAHVAEVLTGDETAWMESHARECAACAGLLSRIRDRLPEAMANAGHAPVSLLERWVRAPAQLTALERELLRRHLAECDTCREEAGVIAELSGVAPVAVLPWTARRRRRWALGGGLVAAATLLAVFSVQLRDRSRSGTSGEPSPSLPSPSTRGEMIPSPRVVRTVSL